MVVPPVRADFKPGENIIAGNTLLYGATSGEVYLNGRAGERFCVRNSGATAVVEGCGDHGLEYMTGGRAVILGEVGKNFAAGMSGGVAYVLDVHHELYKKLNKSLVTMSEVNDKYDRQELRTILENYVRETGSVKASAVLADFDTTVTSFKKIIPNDYAKMMSLIGRFEESGISRENAQLEAFLELKKGA